MRIRSKQLIVAVALLGTNSVYAATLDWSTVSLTGAFPEYSLTNATLGDITISYSIDTEFSGLTNVFPSRALAFGDTGGETLAFSWSNPVESMNIQFWDLDANPGTLGESLTFTTTAGVSLVSLGSTDLWNAGTETLSSDGSQDANGQLDNFSILNFSNPSGFSEIVFNWSIDSGVGSTGIGNITVVPLPAAFWLFGSGLIGLAGMAKLRRKK
ncbi:MAG: hypothetical protein BMS9Abin33_0957 [Gammaproteobacteria bacterium]|nr:MAG: hypothetical protein BMS9Abin33_0957 [Gammaproteobacteria bacterium]